MNRRVEFRIWGPALVLALSLWGCFAGRPPGGTAEGEGGFEVGDGTAGSRCAIDDDCKLGSCVEGHCYPVFLQWCADEQFAFNTNRNLGDPATVDCGVWGGTCIPGYGCTFPVGSECPAFFGNCVEGGRAFPCSDEGVCDPSVVDDHPELPLEPSPASFDEPTSGFFTDGNDTDCFVLSTPIDAVVSRGSGSLRAATSFFQDGAKLLSTRAYVHAGAFQVCVSAALEPASSDPTYVFSMVAEPPGGHNIPFCDRGGLVQPFLGAEPEACPGKAVCTVRDWRAGCRLPAGEPCVFGADDCQGVCVRSPDGTSRCSDERPSMLTDALTCRDGRYFPIDTTKPPGAGIVFALGITAIDVCPDRCEPGFGCVQDLGDTCLLDQLCAVDDVETTCVDEVCTDVPLLEEP